MKYLCAIALLVSSATAIAQAPADGARRIAIVYAINNFGNVEPQGCPHKILHDGGIPRRMTLVQQLRAAERPMLLLDGGSTLFPEVDKPKDDEKEQMFLKAEFILEGMNRMGYQAMAVGSTDFLLGYAELAQLTSSAKFALLAANFSVRTPDGKLQTPFAAHKMFEVGGVKVGVVGLLLENMGKVYLQKVAPGAEISPAGPAAKKAAQELKQAGADLIVALSHSRMEINRQIVKDVPEIDILIDPSIEYGNHHGRIKDEEWQEIVGSTLILRADGNGSTYGVLEVDFRGAGRGMGSRYLHDVLKAKQTEGSITAEEKAEAEALGAQNHFFLRRLALAPHLADDIEGLALQEAFKKGTDLKAVPSTPAGSARKEFLGAQACEGCHKKQHDFWKSTKHYNAMASIHASNSSHLPECIACHTTGYGPAFVKPADAEIFNGIQCEACHGTRPEHVQDPKANRFLQIAESTCLPCHNEDVLHKDFSYGTAVRKAGCPKG